MKFDTKGLRRKDFKTQEDYLGAVYDKNPIIGEKKLSKKNFVELVKAYKENEEISVTKAIKKVANTRTFTPSWERAIDNFVEGLKKNYPGAVKALSTSIRDEKGHFTGFKKSELKWDSDRRAYVYMGKIMIDITNSPQQISMVRL